MSIATLPPNCLALALVLSAASGPVPAQEAPAPAPSRASGEPYRLAGSRIVFSNWYFVRPGSHAWVDDAGNGVSANRGARIEDWGAHFRTYDMPRGIRLVTRPATRRADVITPQKPWEKRLSVNVLIRDGDRLRFWGTCPDACYLESRDGVTWERPSLGLVEREGSRDNNLCPGVPGGFLFLDPAAPAAERYKALGVDTLSDDEFAAFLKARPGAVDPRARRTDVGHAYALKGFTSADGFTWTSLPRPLSVEHADTQNTGYYDAQLRTYVLYTRTWWVGDQDPAARGTVSPDNAWIAPGRRAIGRSESDVFADFPVSTAIVVPPPDVLPSEVLYTNCKTTIPGQPDNHLMFPAVWNMDSDATRLVMLSSTDGKVWNWLPGTALDSGDFATFDGGAIFASPNLVEFANGDFALPYNGYRFPHKYPRGGEGFAPTLGFAVWPKGRLCAIEAAGQGEFTTVGFIPPGNRLRINAVTRRAGGVLVEVCALNPGCTNLQPLPGRSFADATPIVGDQFRTLVTWKGAEDLGQPLGQPVALRFRLNQAAIYALDFE